MSGPTNPWDVGYCVNPEPPEPPMGTELAMAHRPGECDWYRGPYGWRMPAWDNTGVVDPDRGETWAHVRMTFGPMVVCGHRDTEMPDGTVRKAWHDPAKVWPFAQSDNVVEFRWRRYDVEARDYVEFWRRGEVVGTEISSGDRFPDDVRLKIAPYDDFNSDVHVDYADIRRPAD